MNLEENKKSKDCNYDDTNQNKYTPYFNMEWQHGNYETGKKLANHPSTFCGHKIKYS